MPLQSARKLVEPDVTVLELTGRITLAESRDLEELVHGVAAEKVTNEELRKWLESLNDEDLGRYKM